MLRRTALAAAGLLLAGCAGGPGTAPVAEAPVPRSPAPDGPPTPTPTPSPTPAAEPEESGPEASDGTPRRATLTIAELGIRGVAVVPYRGRPDDAAGTRIQDGGIAASPHGPRGGTGVGGIGNYIVTGHRLSSTQLFLDLPELHRGDRVSLRAGGVRYVYEIRRTRRTSFRSPDSLRAQAAAVPGRPGEEPTRAMITISTCATPEDRAAGNYWTDEFGNPEHRIDKIGVLVRTSTA